jgi:hypothetical protein
MMPKPSLIFVKAPAPHPTISVGMTPFVYRCPNTGLDVQGFAADDPEREDETYETVTCLVCTWLHLVNPKTGKVLGAGE